MIFEYKARNEISFFFPLLQWKWNKYSFCTYLFTRDRSWCKCTTGLLLAPCELCYLCVVSFGSIPWEIILVFWLFEKIENLSVRSNLCFSGNFEFFSTKLKKPTELQKKEWEILGPKGLLVSCCNNCNNCEQWIKWYVFDWLGRMNEIRTDWLVKVWIDTTT